MDDTKHSAEFLELVYAEYTNPELTKAEIDFIVSKIEPRSRVLDIGCGTGRHAIALAMQGFDVVGLDNTQAMLDELRKKLDREGVKVDLRYADILGSNAFDREFDAAICFWNSFDQIGSDTEKGRLFFRNVCQSLKEGGKLILEISNPHSFDPNAYVHQSTVERGGHTIEMTYRLRDYDPARKTSIGNERIVVKRGGETLRQTNSDFLLRWWEREEVTDIARACGFGSVDVYGNDYAAFEETSETLLFVIAK